MIRITKLTDYGIVLLTYIAAQPKALTHTARDLAGEIHLPRPMVGKILKALTRAGLLVSHRGVKGGYGLARDPESITIADVVTALDGPIAMTECIGHSPSPCVLDVLCPVRNNWERINDAVRGALEKITLSQMTAPLGASWGTRTGIWPAEIGIPAAQG